MNVILKTFLFQISNTKYVFTKKLFSKCVLFKYILKKSLIQRLISYHLKSIKQSGTEKHVQCFVIHKVQKKKLSNKFCSRKFCKILNIFKNDRICLEYDLRMSNQQKKSVGILIKKRIGIVSGTIPIRTRNLFEKVYSSKF